MPTDEEWERFTRESFERDRAQDERLAEHGAAIKSNTAVQATVVDVVKTHATQAQVDKLDTVQREQILPTLAVHQERLMSDRPSDNSTAGALGGLTGFVREARQGKPLNLAIIFLGLPCTLFMLAFLLAAATGNARDFIDGVGTVIHGPADSPVEIRVEDGADIHAESLDADDVEIDAENATVTERPAP